MAVVIGQSRATAHVYRMFGALLAMLLIMAVAVAVIRIRSDRAAGSPYGALASAAVHTPAAPPNATGAAPAAPVAAIATAPSPVAASVASDGSPSSVPVSDHVVAPRQIALGRDAASAAVPQPAPPALVAAAAVAAAAPPRVAATPPAVKPADPAVPAAAPAASPEKVAALPRAATDVAPEPTTGRININTASVDQLNTLPGVGRIGRWIASHRPYRSIDDLVDRRVLKASDFARIRAAISTN